jgi:uncharacterized damage-inducible protein DinB
MNLQTEHQELCQSVVEALRQGEAMLVEISDETFTRKLPVAFNASIGGHYRHCLDHFRTLLKAAPGGDLNYDHRERDTLIENDRFAALNETRELIAGWENLNHTFVARRLGVICKTSYSASGSQSASSTVGREIMYTVAHAVHHYAIIGMMAGIMGKQLPPNFGIAPSTLKHQQETAKVG